MATYALFFSLLFGGQFAGTSTVLAQPEELGAVHWLRDYEVALAEAKASGKPVFILFQEVPGCSNCTRYGNEILRHPLLVEAIEDEFVPLAVFNNKGGPDAAVLKRYGEPAWNNPVTRIVDATGKDLVDRMPNFQSTAQLTAGMTTALRRHGREVPAYLRVVHEEQAGLASTVRTATFTTACFWSGEGFFGQQQGVLATDAGWQQGQEVVRVTYDANALSPQALANVAAGKHYAVAAPGSFRLDREPKYYLLRSRFRMVPMTNLQASRVNAMLGQGRSPEGLLSPRQLAVLARAVGVPGLPVGYGESSLQERWAALASVLDKG